MSGKYLYFHKYCNNHSYFYLKILYFTYSSPYIQSHRYFNEYTQYYIITKLPFDTDFVNRDYICRRGALPIEVTMNEKGGNKVSTNYLSTLFIFCEIVANN